MSYFELRDSQGFHFKVDREWLRVGRSDDNDIVIRDPAVSRYHLNFYLKNDQLIVEDAGSQNGFLVNGAQAAGATALKHGDRIYFGSREYLIESYFPQKISLETFNSVQEPQNFNYSAVSVPATGSNGRLLLYGGAALLLAFVFIPTGQKPASSRSPASSIEDLPLAAINADGYAGEKYTQRSLTDVQAEQRYKEALRDYNNENYSRALLGFQEALTLNSSHEAATEYLQKTEVEIKNRLESLLKDAQRSYQILQFRRAKERAMRVLSVLSDENPNYGRKIAEEGLSAQSTSVKSQGQEEILLKFPCKESREQKICSSALDIIRRSRERLGEEDVIK